LAGTIVGMVFNQNTITTDAPVGTEVGTVTITTSDGTAFSGALTLTGPYASYFQLTATRDPFSITAVNLDNVTVPASSPSGTKVGTVTVTLSDHSVFSGTLTLTQPGGTPTGAWMNHFAFGGNEFYLPWVGEIEYMCDNGTGRVSSTGYAPFAVSSSILSITAQTVAASGISNPVGQLWNSGCITSCREINGEPVAGLFSTKFGYFEMRCQVPAGGPANGGPGLWPAFVLYPLALTDANGVVIGNAPAGEIDIFEILGGSPGTVRQSIHSSIAGSNAEYDYTGAGDMSAGFHTIGCDVQSNNLTFYVDNVQTAQQATPSDFINNGNIWYINCPLSVGGAGSWVGSTPVSVGTSIGVWQIDYIGVWTNHASAYPSGTLVKGNAVFLDDFDAVDISFDGAVGTVGGGNFTLAGFDLRTSGGLTGGTIYPITITAADPNSTNGQLAAPFSIAAQTTGAVPGPLTQVTSPTQDASSITVNWAPPVTGGVMDTGVHQIQYKAHSSGIWLNATSVPYITPGNGSFTDAAGNTWTVNAAGHPVINGTNVDTPSTVKIMYKIAGTIWQLDLFDLWYSTVGGIAPSWTGPISISPLSLSVTGLTASTPYDIQGFASNGSGTGAASAPIQATTQAASQPGGTGPPATSAFMTVDFASARNYTNGGTGQQIVDRKMWGVSTGGAADTSYQAFGDATQRASFGTINPGIWRVNGDQTGRGDSRFWNSDGSVNTSTFSNLITYFPQVDPLGISSFIIGANVPPLTSYPGNITDPTSYGAAMGRLATYLNNAVMPNGKKFPIIGFESQNEPDGHIDVSSLLSYYNAMCTAVRAVNPNFLCCGPTVASGGFFGNTFQSGANRLDVYDWHLYIGGYPSIQASPRYTSTRGPGDMQGVVGNTNIANVSAFFLGEVNIDWNCSDPALQTYEGAIFMARILLEELNVCPRPFWAAVWDAFFDNLCGVVRPGGAICPTGYLLGAGVRTIYGPRWNVPSNNSGLLTCAVSQTGGHFGLMVVNPGFGGKSGQVALSHWPVNSTGNGTANVWQINSGTSGDGARSTVQVTAGVTASINFPDPSVTIISI